MFKGELIGLRDLLMRLPADKQKGALLEGLLQSCFS